MPDYEPDDGPLTPAKIKFIQSILDQDRDFKATKKLFESGESPDLEESSKSNGKAKD